MAQDLEKQCECGGAGGGAAEGLLWGHLQEAGLTLSLTPGMTHSHPRMPVGTRPPQAAHRQTPEKRSLEP